MSSKKIYLTIILVVVLALVLFWIQRNIPKPENILASNENQNIKQLETLNFCDHEYQSNPVILFNIDMMRRIAMLASQQPETQICKNIIDYHSGPVLTPELKYIPEDTSGIYYYLNIGQVSFSFNPETEEIYVLSAYDGSPSLIGSFK
ncbi:MAG: hypothetical protein JWM46_445 [Candidatus Kaiserbacteria bacterium]|nr:hypothetical protein [Candidatus Kaiserbacteria bacterium]